MKSRGQNIPIAFLREYRAILVKIHKQHMERSHTIRGTTGYSSGLRDATWVAITVLDTEAAKIGCKLNDGPTVDF